MAISLDYLCSFSFKALLDVVEVLTSLNHLNNLRFNLFRREIWSNHNANGIATKLRNANSSFSYLEIREVGASGWKNSAAVWNEVFGVFYHIESVVALYSPLSPLSEQLSESGVDGGTGNM